MLKNISRLALLGLTVALLVGCKVKSYERHQIRVHEGLVHALCADKGGAVQVNIDGCSVPGFPFYGELVEKNGAFYETKTLRDGKQVRFDRRLNAGQCATVNIVNMDDGQNVTCNFHIYWDL